MLEAETENYSLINMNNLKEEIISQIKYAKAKGITSDLSNPDGAVEECKGLTKSTRVLRNKTVQNALPGRVIGEAGVGIGDIKEFICNGISDLKSMLKTGSDNILINEYIMAHFKNMHHQDVGHETFFKNEVEYILEGSYDDDKNRRKVRNDIIAVREAANLISIKRDVKLSSEVTALASTLPKSVGGKATEKAIASIWALYESENDMRLLECGKKIVTIKDHKSWVTDLESAWKGVVKDEMTSESDSGLCYEDYLKLLLIFQKQTNKMGRIMDLIQINMKGNYNENFLIRECNCGFQLKACVNGEKYEYEEKY